MLHHEEVCLTNPILPKVGNPDLGHDRLFIEQTEIN